MTDKKNSNKVSLIRRDQFELEKAKSLIRRGLDSIDMAGGEGEIRLLIVDDISETRARIRELVKPAREIRIIGEARDGFEAIQMYDELCPDVVSMNINMPEMDGLTSTRVICNRYPDAKIFTLSVVACDLQYMRLACCYAGALDFLDKPPHSDELIEIIRWTYRVQVTDRRHEIENAFRKSTPEKLNDFGIIKIHYPEISTMIDEAIKLVSEMLLLCKEIVAGRKEIHNSAERLDNLYQSSFQKINEAQLKWQDLNDFSSQELAKLSKVPQIYLPERARAYFNLKWNISAALLPYRKIQNCMTRWMNWKLTSDEFCAVIRMWLLDVISDLQGGVVNQFP